MTNEEQNERYVLEIRAGRVNLIDMEENVTLHSFQGPSRLMAATTELDRLNAQEEIRSQMAPAAFPSKPTRTDGTPAHFLSKTLPAVARRQRLEVHLAEVKEIEESLVRVLAEDAANLKRATALREKLEKELARPLNATQSAEKAPGVGQGTPFIRNGYGYPTALRPYQAEMRREMFKPGPY